MSCMSYLQVAQPTRLCLLSAPLSAAMTRRGVVDGTGTSVLAKDDVAGGLAKEDGKEDIAVVVHAEKHAAGYQEGRNEGLGTYTRKAAENWDPYRRPRRIW